MSQRKRNSRSTITKKGTSSTRKTTKFDAILKLIAFAYVVLTIMFYISVLKMDMLPGGYVTVFTMAEIIFTFGIMVGLTKKRKSIKINVVFLIIIIIISIVYINAINYVLATINFIGNVFTQVSETEEYYVIAKKGSTYTKIEDIKNKDVYLFQIDNSVQGDLKNTVSVNLKTNDNLTDLGNKLLNKEIDTALVSSTQYQMLSDEIENFKDNTKIIYTVNHKIITSAKVENTNSKQMIENGIFNVYISGIDTSGKISNVARSDANILVTVNTKTHEVLLTSIPRDYYVTLHSKKAKDKLTHSGIYGVSETVTTVEDLLDIDINYYVRVNFTTVIKLVDTLSGIDVYSDYEFSRDGYTFKKGYNHIGGDAALTFSRERYSFAAGDNQRVKNQQHVIEAIMKKVASSTTILTKYTDILKSMEGCFQTNIEQSEISKLVKDQINNMSSWTVKSNALTGTGSYGPTYSMGSQKLYIMLPDSSSVSAAKQQIKAITKE